MDRLIYTAMTGAKHILEQQATTSNNLANATTTGFRAQLDSFRAVPVLGEGLPTRTFVVDATVGSDFRSGSIQQTGRDLDVAVQGEGWIAIERPDGSEGYTRHGSLKLNENGVLQTQSGMNVMGDGGPITIPPNVVVSIAKDGTISSVDKTGTPAASTALARIKLVNPPTESLVRGDDGLFSVKDGNPADADAGVALLGGALEGSNVNVVEAMVGMIAAARQYDTQMKLLQSAEQNDQRAAQLLGPAR